MQTLGDSSRLAILRLLALGEHRVVTSRAQGRASVFSLAQPELVLGVLAAAGDAVSLCPVSGKAAHQ